MRFFLADRQQSTRSALRLLFEQYPGMEYAGETGKSENLLVMTTELKPDLILVEWAMLQAAPEDRVKALKEKYPVTVTVIHNSGELRNRALAAGADFYISKVDKPECLTALLERIASGNGDHDQTNSPDNKSKDTKK